MIRKWTALAAVFVLAGGAVPTYAVDLTAGPMIGHVTDTSARLWLQFPVAGDVTINAFEVETSQQVSSLRVGLEGPTPFVCDVPVSGLKANKNYRVEIKFDGQPVKMPELVIRTAPLPGEEATFSIAFGGGIDIAPLGVAGAATQPAPILKPHKMPVFAAIENAKPRAFFFLGQIGQLPPKLADWPTTHRAAYRFVADFHTMLRREPDMQTLFHTTPSYYVYADRDFGPLDVGAGAAAGTGAAASGAGAGGGEFVFNNESLVAFQRFWPNPDWGTPENPGCFAQCSYGDVDFFLLDGRTFRSPTAANGGNAFLGSAQLAWLEKNLKASKASFKVLASAYPLFDAPADAESWAQYPAERDAFLQWLGENQITGVLATVGGQLTAAITKFVAPADLKIKYPLLTVTTAKLFDPDAELKTESFGTLDFGGTREHRFLTLRLRDGAGKVKAEQTVLAVSLRS